MGWAKQLWGDQKKPKTAADKKDAWVRMQGLAERVTEIDRPKDGKRGARVKMPCFVDDCLGLT